MAVLAMMLSVVEPPAFMPPTWAPVEQDMPAPAAPPQDTPAAEPAPAQTVPPPPAAAAPQANDIVVTARGAWEAPDPLDGINAKAFDATMKVDRALIGPVSMAYKKKVPGPVRDGIHNFLYNLREPVVFVNFLLQHKIGKAVETVGRFAVNTTIGAIGLFDIARRRPFRLPRRSNGFANTLGFYGVPNGAFLYLPLVGPTTVRDLFGGAIDRLILPIALGRGVTDPKFALPAGVLGALDHRAEFDETYKAIGAAPGDPYRNARDFYLQRRQAEIDRLHGRGRAGSGGMTEAPTGTIRLRGRGGAPTVELPVTPDPVPSLAPPAPVEGAGGR
ncbi:VacJ family lipoprotein [Sphingomonas sp. A2-49]|uniref:MlaA family lipoprotein n=1 Tax=Sphingomonas sp. A2-49 TaxID=1391375 RepID=UPI0021D103D0|nr:VacJ family lipoprotein [Sphingomonas sp. A2-49]MCU6455706.1 VacJ family lipoprotein [Sphingomonas sp. A2-49]